MRLCASETLLDSVDFGWALVKKKVTAQGTGDSQTQRLLILSLLGGSDPDAPDAAKPCPTWSISDCSGALALMASCRAG